MNFKYDKARKEIKLNGKRYKGQTLDYFVQQNTFDKHESKYLNYKGLTFVLSNPVSTEDEVIDVDITLVNQDAPELTRVLAGMSEQDKTLRNEILEDYGY